MAEILKNGDEIGIIGNDVNGEQRTIHLVNAFKSNEIVGGSFGGFQTTLITNIESAADGANTIVRVVSFPPWGVERATGRLTDTVEELTAAFEEAGLSCPEIEQPKLKQRAIEFVRRYC